MRETFEIIDRTGQWQKCDIQSFTDGEKHHWPRRPPFHRFSNEKHLIHLANAWMRTASSFNPTTNYYLNKLPDGYAVFARHRSDGSRIDKYVFGHPSGSRFDSLPKFEVHFLWLMAGMRGLCRCFLCSNMPRGGHPYDLSLKDSSRIQRRARQASSMPSHNLGRLRHPIEQTISGSKDLDDSPKSSYIEAEDQTENVFKKFMRQLYLARDSGVITETDIRETNSLDWRAEHETGGLLDSFWTLIKHQHSFIPRLGELVLWCSDIPEELSLMLDYSTATYKMYCHAEKRFYGHPTWRAGVIAAGPTRTENFIGFRDLQNLTEAPAFLNTSSFRVETLTDNNDDQNKTSSKQYRYVPMSNIRPLSHWQSVLNGIVEQNWHPSVSYGLKCMTTISLFHKWQASGLWPNATLHCKGIYIGSELIAVGDPVRMISKDSRADPKCNDVLVVEDIRLNLANLIPDNIFSECQRLCQTSTITFVGKAYTMEKQSHHNFVGQGMQEALTKSDDITAIRTAETMKLPGPVDLNGYGPWFYLHDPENRYEISYDQLLGRLFEAQAIRLWNGQHGNPEEGANLPRPIPHMSFDTVGILTARKLATNCVRQTDQVKIHEIFWQWNDTRAQALELRTINGLEVGKYDQIRDLDTQTAWNAQMKILQGHAISSKLLRRAAFPSKQKVKQNEIDMLESEIPWPSSQMVDAALESTPSDYSDTFTTRVSKRKANTAPKSRKTDSGTTERTELATEDTDDVDAWIEEAYLRAQLEGDIPDDAEQYDSDIDMESPRNKMRRAA